MLFRVKEHLPRPHGTASDDGSITLHRLQTPVVVQILGREQPPEVRPRILQLPQVNSVSQQGIIRAFLD